MNELDMCEAMAELECVGFKRLPVSKKSLSQRSLVHGVGVNDAAYIVRGMAGKKKSICPVYARWADMIARCYSGNSLRRNKRYSGCGVCTEWKTFSNFASWFEINNVDGWHLDKDIKIVGNKVYSPDTCLLIPSELNHLLADSLAIRGLYPIGVALFKRTGRFISYIRIDGKKKHLGYFDTPEEAHEKYRGEKNAEIMRKCEQWPQFAEYLINHLIG